MNPHEQNRFEIVKTLQYTQSTNLKGNYVHRKHPVGLEIRVPADKNK